MRVHKTFPPPPEQLIIPEFVDDQVLLTQIQSLQQIRDWMSVQIEEMDDELIKNQEVINSQKRMIAQLTAERTKLDERHRELVAALRSAHTELLSEIDEKDRALRDVLLDRHSDEHTDGNK